jgi:hypothetical protein
MCNTFKQFPLRCGRPHRSYGKGKIQLESDKIRNCITRYLEKAAVRKDCHRLRISSSLTDFPEAGMQIICTGAVTYDSDECIKEMKGLFQKITYLGKAFWERM